MYTKITPTFEKLTIKEYFEKHNIKGIDHINDTFMMGECFTFTKAMMDAGMELNTICKIIKNYQQKYIYIKNENPEMAKLFTIEMWNRLNQKPEEE